MAKCQSRYLGPLSANRSQAASVTNLKKDRLKMASLMLLMTLSLVLFVQQAFAEIGDASDAFLAESTIIAMGDVGQIKTDVDPDPAHQVKWAALSEEQKKVLAPLSAEWDTLRPWQREKMLDIARDYPKMDAQKQARVQKRLNSWSRMTPYERENARKRYQQFHSLSPDKKDEMRKKWAAYQKLPEAERDKLRKDSALEYDPDLD